MKSIISIFIILISILFCFVGCSSKESMPFNGEVSFHEIKISIPEKFIRDSTQSNDDVWFFEKGFYKQCIIMSRTDIVGDVTASMDGYIEYMREQGNESNYTTFMGHDAVLTTYFRDEQYCQEMLFANNGSFYAIAFRGSNETEFNKLLDTVLIEGE